MCTPWMVLEHQIIPQTKTYIIMRTKPDHINFEVYVLITITYNYIHSLQTFNWQVTSSLYILIDVSQYRKHTDELQIQNWYIADDLWWNKFQQQSLGVTISKCIHQMATIAVLITSNAWNVIFTLKHHSFQHNHQNTNSTFVIGKFHFTKMLEMYWTLLVANSVNATSCIHYIVDSFVKC